MPHALLNIRGKTCEWGVTAQLSQQAIDDMRDDGIEIGIIENIVPYWVAAIGAARPWCFVQDIWNLKNPFRK